MNKLKKFLIILLIIILVLALGISITGYIYFGDYYHAEEDVKDYLESTPVVEVSYEENGLFLDNKENTKDLIIFYPGAKVEYLAYAKLLRQVADNNIDVYIVNMPLNFAFLGINKADKILENHNYDNVYLAGHSLGGVASSNYTYNNQDKVKGLILFGSYSVKKLDENIKVLSIIASNDKVLSMDAYNENKDMINVNDFTEYVIEGGTHAGFANYGEQANDGSLEISKELQQGQTVQKIIEFIKNR